MNAHEQMAGPKASAFSQQTAHVHSDVTGGTLPFVLGSVVLGTIGLFLHQSGADPLTATWFRCAFGLLGLTLWAVCRRQLRSLLPGRKATFALLAAGEVLPAAWQLALMVAVTIAFDFGVQVALVGHQTLVYRLEPAARSRLNALLLTGMFIGMAAGSALGSQALLHGGWLGVAGLCAVASAGAWMLRRRG